MKLKGRRKAPAHQNSHSFLATRCPREELGTLGAGGRQLGRRMASRKAVRLSPKKPTYAVCVVGVRTYVDVRR